MKLVGRIWTLQFNGEIYSQDLQGYTFTTDIYVKDNNNYFVGNILERKPGFYTMMIQLPGKYVYDIVINFKHWETACKKLKNKLVKLGFTLGGYYD